MNARMWNLRKAIQAVLVDSGLWTEEEILIRRRGNIWNDVATAIGASKHGSVVVIGVAEGKREGARPPQSTALPMGLTVPISLIEEPQPDPTEIPEDALFEEMLLVLEGSTLGRTERKADFAFEDFGEIDHPHYLIRQATFKTRLVLGPRKP